MGKILKIITNPNPSLRKKSLEIKIKELNSKKMNNFISEITKTMKEKDGIGLAAPQVGKNIRLVIINTVDGPVCLINPKITKKSIIKEWGEEGCLSVPGIFGEVKRHNKIICKFKDSKNKEKKIEANGMLARVIQHEIDHLDGILFIDKMRKKKGDGKK